MARLYAFTAPSIAPRISGSLLPRFKGALDSIVATRLQRSEQDLRFRGKPRFRRVRGRATARVRPAAPSNWRYKLKYLMVAGAAFLAMVGSVVAQPRAPATGVLGEIASIMIAPEQRAAIVKFIIQQKLQPITIDG